MKLKKLKKRNKNIYSYSWNQWIKMGVENTDENKQTWLENRGTKGSWFLDLLCEPEINENETNQKDPEMKQAQEQSKETK